MPATSAIRTSQFAHASYGPGASLDAPKPAGATTLRQPSPVGFTAEQIAPFHALEQQYAWLFQTPLIQRIDSAGELPASQTLDVDMDGCAVINTSHGAFDSIGTTGVATCVAICAKGNNHRGETILGLLHYSGIAAAEDALSALGKTMRNAGVQAPDVFLVGGLISNEEDSGSLESERNLLALHSAFNIRGAKLHLSMSRSDDEANYVDVVMTADRIYYYHDA